MPEGSDKKTLRQKFEIPINHLDFEYIKGCNDTREIEKIVRILRSGEEGYFPDLTRCAEDKLKELKPNSRLFRYEEQLKNLASLNKDEVKTYHDWWHEVRNYDQELHASQDYAEDEGLTAPVRDKIGKICGDKNNIKESDKMHNKKDDIVMRKPTSTTDYRKWDRYDADEEITRMELAEEREKEAIERQNRKIIADKQKSMPLITELQNGEERLKLLTNIERKQLAEQHRLRGNEFYQAKEYEDAAAEYTRSIQINPTLAAAAYNNRAITYIKMKQYQSAINDCDDCLSLEPRNVKAHLRLADAHFRLGKLQESLNVYERVLELDPKNTLALSNVKSIRLTLFGDASDNGKAPKRATRLTIQEESSNAKKQNQATENLISKESKPKESKAAKAAIKSDNSVEKTMAKALISPKDNKTATKKSIDYDFAELVKPNVIVKSNLAKAAEVFGGLKPPNKNISESAQQPKNESQKLTKILTHPAAMEKSDANDMSMLLTSNTPKHISGPLIQEI